MADYYPLIARAVAGLEKNTGQGRRNVYERAREALVAQLRGVTPALSESDVTRERTAHAKHVTTHVKAWFGRDASPPASAVSPILANYKQCPGDQPEERHGQCKEYLLAPAGAFAMKAAVDLSV